MPWRSPLLTMREMDDWGSEGVSCEAGVTQWVIHACARVPPDDGVRHYAKGDGIDGQDLPALPFVPNILGRVDRSVVAPRVHDVVQEVRELCVGQLLFAGLLEQMLGQPLACLFGRVPALADN